MGQYHKVVNLDKKEVINPHNLCCGIKLLEFSESRVTTALCALLAVSNNRGGGDLSSENSLVGSWAGDRIAIIGDYWEKDEADETGIPTWDMMGEEEGGEYTDISIGILHALCEDSYLREDLLRSVAWYDYGRDWSDFFSEEELNTMRDKIKQEREQENGV